MLYQRFPAIKPAFRAVRQAEIKELAEGLFAVTLYNEDGTPYVSYKAHLAEYGMFLCNCWVTHQLETEI